ERQQDADQRRRRGPLAEDGELEQRRQDDQRAGEKPAARGRGALQALRLQEEADSEQRPHQGAVAQEAAADETQLRATGRSRDEKGEEQRGGHRHAHGDEQERRGGGPTHQRPEEGEADRKSTRLNSSHANISYAV